ncbi:hypothetical protein HRbin08_00455 [bacterium HR08]|nr:hypothetical protein HRbin08_00455 [bacterium HR08]
MPRGIEDRDIRGSARMATGNAREPFDRSGRWVVLLALGVLLAAPYMMRAPSPSVGVSGATLEERVKRIGKKLLCLCGCNQILVECNHRNCPFSGPAIATLRQAAQRYESDDLAIQAMIQQYGTAILAAPPAQGFNLTAWITPFVAAASGLVVIALVLRRWSRRSAATPTMGAPISDDPAWRERVRQEIERELGDLP